MGADREVGDAYFAMNPDAFTERMNELIAWAEERAAEHETDAAEWDYGSREWADHEGAGAAFREVANHLRQLSQGAKMKGELKEAVERLTKATKTFVPAASYRRGTAAENNDALAQDIRTVLAALSKPEGQPAMGVEEAARDNEKLRAAIMWALGEGDSDFAEPDPPIIVAGRVARYWWRKELRERAGAALSPQPVPARGEEGVG